MIAEERPRIQLTTSFTKLFANLGLTPRSVSTSFGCRVNLGMALQVRFFFRDSIYFGCFTKKTFLKYSIKSVLDECWVCNLSKCIFLLSKQHKHIYSCKWLCFFTLQGASCPDPTTVYVDKRAMRNDRVTLVEKGSPHSLCIMESGKVRPSDLIT